MRVTKSNIGMAGGVVGRLLAAGLATVVLGGLATALTSAPAGASKPLVPSADPFYKWTGSLAHEAPGTVLRTRAIHMAEGPIATPVRAHQLLYVTTDELGQRSVSVTTVLQPLAKVIAPVGATHLLSYQMAYDALGSKCDPSFTLQGGNSSYQSSAVESQILYSYVALGYTVESPDYEGENLAFGAGQQSGYGTLDAIRATESWLGVPEVSTPVGMVGYSGGSIATDFAAELAPTYAADLDIVGVAEGGIPVDLFHNLAYIDYPTSGWTGVIPGALDGIARGFDITDFDKYLTPLGISALRADQNVCIDEFVGLTTEQMFKPQYQNIEKVPLFVRLLDHLIMSHTGTPREPMLIGVGDVDGTGDGVMIDKDVQALAYAYCQRGVPVQFNVYKKFVHTIAYAPFAAQAIAFFTDRFADVPFLNGCNSIAPGNSLAPVPMPAS